MDHLIKACFTPGELKKMGSQGGKTTYRFLASSEKEDRLGDIIHYDGWDFKNFEKNPVILWAHDSHSPPVGTAKIVKDDKAKSFYVDVEFHGEENTLSPLVERLVEKGIVKGASVGFWPKSGMIKSRYDDDDNFLGFEVFEQELLEVSVVPIPAHQDALLQASMTEFSDDEKQLVYKGLGFRSEGDMSRRRLEVIKLFGKTGKVVKRGLKRSDIRRFSKTVDKMTDKLTGFGDAVSAFESVIKKIQDAVEIEETSTGSGRTMPVETVPDELPEDIVKKFEDLIESSLSDSSGG